ncbi:MAG: hypothetical protein K8S99_15365 [Planctomycetes bacterium]|nr:hypothetical protein [Planctomycetota bacterium]
MKRSVNNSGMSLVETILAAAVIAMVLTGLVVASNSLRTEKSDKQTRETLQKLQIALSIYHDRHREYPAGPTDRALSAMWDDADTRPSMRRLDLSRDEHGQLICRDGYATPVLYIAPQPGARHKPEFVSAGRDGSMGDLTSTTADQRRDAMDNLYSSDTEGHTP